MGGGGGGGGLMELIDIFRVKLYFFTIVEVNKTVAQNLAEYLCISLIIHFHSLIN